MVLRFVRDIAQYENDTELAPNSYFGEERGPAYRIDERLSRARNGRPATIAVHPITTYSRSTRITGSRVLHGKLTAMYNKTAMHGLTSDDPDWITCIQLTESGPEVGKSHPSSLSLREAFSRRLSCSFAPGTVRIESVIVFKGVVAGDVPHHQ